MTIPQCKLISMISLYAAIVVPNFASAVAVSGQGTWETTLQERDLDGNLSTSEAYYDTVLNITWLANANYAGTTMNWIDANTWATSLDIGGYTGWRLPTVSPVDGTTADDANSSWIGTEDRGYNVSAPFTLYAGSTASEMAHMYYNTLGDKGYCDPIISGASFCRRQFGIGLTNTGPFTNIQSGVYWSATEYAPLTGYPWSFGFHDGGQDYNAEASGLYAWAVHSGDVGNVVTTSTVPVPAATWLFGSGMLSLICAVKRRWKKISPSA